MDLKPLFKTYVEFRVEGLNLKVVYLENRHHNFIQNKHGKKEVCRAHTFRSLDFNFFFLYGLLTPLMTSKG